MKKEKSGNNHNGEPKFLKSGITGLDSVLNPGIRRNSSVIVAGGPGSGKSIFALQFAIEGAKNGEPSLYITTEETIESIRDYAKSLGLHIEKKKKKGMLHLIEQRPARGKLMTIEAPLKLIQQKKIKRIVLDSLTLFEYVYSRDVDEYRKGVLQFLFDMIESKVTFLATSERPSTRIDDLEYKPEDSLFEGMVLLAKIRKGSVFERVITIEKLRGQNHMLGIYPFKIEKYGIQVYPQQIPFSLVSEEK